ncbi:MAG: hypothetical protein ACFE8N_08425, partial [Promethearchaeota archaeon]
PNLIPDFVDINKSSQLLDYPSTSITRILFVIFIIFEIQISEFMLLIVSTLILYSILLIILFLIPNMVKNYPLFLGLGILITMISFPDSWFLNFLIWFMVTLPGLFKFEEDLAFMVSDKIKKRLNQSMYLIYKISQYGMLFFTIGIVLDLMILHFDPILPFLLLALYILLIWRLILFLKRKKSS